MRKIIKATLYAALYILILVVLPNLGLQYVSQMIPSEMLPMIETLPLQGIVMSMTLIGVVLAALSFTSNMMEEWSPIKLVSSIASTVVMFYFSLVLFGLGDPSRMGLTQMSVYGATIGLDFRFFITLELLVLGISVITDVAKFYFVRKEHVASV